MWKNNWTGKTIYYGLGAFLLLWLLVYPVWALVMGDGWIVYMISMIIKWEVMLEDIIMLVMMAVWIILIVSVIFTPSENFKSALRFALLHVWKAGWELFSQWDSLKSNPDKYKEVITRFFSYAMLLLIIFVVYLYLITNVKNLALDWAWIGVLLSQMVLIWVVTFSNSWGVSKLEEKDWVISINDWNISIENKNIEWQDNSILLVWALIIANVVALWVWAYFAEIVEMKLQDSWIEDVIQWDASSINIDMFE